MSKADCALLQLLPRGSSLVHRHYDENLQNTIQKIWEASSKARILILPEMCFLRYAPGEEDIGPRTSPLAFELKKLARNLRVHILAGFDLYGKESGKRWSVLGLFAAGSGELHTLSTKIHLQPHERWTYTPGNVRSRAVMMLNEMRYSAWSGADFAEDDAEELFLSQSVDCAFVLSSYGGFMAPEKWRDLLVRRAKMGDCYIVAAAPGAEWDWYLPGGNSYQGCSMVVSPEGKILCQTEEYGQDVLYFDLPPLHVPAPPPITVSSLSGGASGPLQRKTPPKKEKKEQPLSDPQFLPIYKLVRQIPRGRVATFGNIGYLTGFDPQAVSYAVSSCRDPSIPCHRVVDRSGHVKSKKDAFALGDQRAMLEAEGISLDRYGCVPEEYFIKFR